MIEGAVDLLTIEKAIGWLSDRNSKEKFDVVATVDGRIVGEGKANLSRPDLVEVGYGDGMCGFEIAFSSKLAESDLVSVALSPRGSTLIIPRTTKDTYVDVISALTAKYPQAGRSRTVYGGLWTDHTDAAQLLAGRVHAGTCDRSLLAELRAFISDGFVQLDMERAGTPPSQTLAVLADEASDAAQVKDAVLTLVPFHLNARVAHLLKTIFDDIPVAYRPTLVTGSEAAYFQASVFEPFSSPAEVLVCYFLGQGDGARMDYVLDSHELPEFTSGGASRWTTEGKQAIPIIACGSQRPVHSREIREGQCLFLGPGLVHRVVVPAGASVVRAIFSPKRITPLRYLSGSTTWSEVDMGTGVRARL